MSADILARWAHLYSDDKAVSSAVTFVHLAGVLLGGGVAIAADREVLVASAASNPTGARSVHRLVIAGLLVIGVSGMLQFLSDVHTYVTSAVFWTKMGLTLLLLGNGYVRLQAERAVSRGVAVAWRRLRRTSIASLVLWFVILLAGTILSAS